jgi:hypothetical protein
MPQRTDRNRDSENRKSSTDRASLKPTAKSRRYTSWFFNIIETELREKNLELSAPAREIIAQVVTTGAMKLSLKTTSTGADRRNPTRNVAHEVGDKMGILIREITEATKAKGEEAIQVETVQEVMGKICPLWPFC